MSDKIAISVFQNYRYLLPVLTTGVYIFDFNPPTIKVGDLRDYDVEFYVPHDVAKRGKNIKFEKGGGGDIIFGKYVDLLTYNITVHNKQYTLVVLLLPCEQL
jgi:hypothetical protein